MQVGESSELTNINDCDTLDHEGEFKTLSFSSAAFSVAPRSMMQCCDKSLSDSNSQGPGVVSNVGNV